MDSTTITQHANGHELLSGLFRGCFAADRLENVDIRPPYCLLVNFGTNASIGQHWAAVASVDGKTVDFFDAFGLTVPAVIRDWLSSHYERVNTLDRALARTVDINCAKWALMFLVFRLRAPGTSFTDVVEELRCALRKTSLQRHAIHGGIDVLFDRVFHSYAEETNC